MPNFYSLYSSFDDFYSKFYQGNEIEFLYNGEHYYILPTFDDQKNINGVLIGKDTDEQDLICKSKEDLYYSKIAGTLFGYILDKIQIVWYNI